MTAGPRAVTTAPSRAAVRRQALHDEQEHALVVASAVPWLLGFHPGRSLVLVGQDRGRQVCLTLRYDLPDPPRPDQAEAAARLAGVLGTTTASLVTVIAFGPGALAGRPARAPARQLTRSGLPVAGLLRIGSGRFWCLCGAPQCARGRPLPWPGPEPAAGAAALRPALASRASLTAAQAPIYGPEADAVSGAIRALGARTFGVGRDIAVMLEALGRCRRGEAVTDPGRVAALLVSLRDVRVRDLAWSLMDSSHTAGHQQLWAGLVRRAPAGYRAAPASLLAFTACQEGKAALARAALDAALSDDPRYSIARRLRFAADSGASASLARPAVTPEQVADAYGMTGAYRGAALRSGWGTDGGIHGVPGHDREP